MEKFRGLRKDFVNCTSECCIEENFNRIQDMYGYDHSYSYDNSGYEDGVEMFFKHLNPDGYFRVSDTAPAYEDIIGATYTAPTPSGNTQLLEVMEDHIEWIVKDKVLRIFDGVIVAFEDCDYQRNHYFEGVYFLRPEGEPNSLSKTIRKYIDPKFSPVPDWNAFEGEKGYIKNRTHYDETVVIDSVTQTIPDSATVPNGYGTLSNVYLLSTDLVMPEGKYILFQMGDVKIKFYSLPPNTGSASRPTYKEDITLSNGVTIRWQLDRNDPASGRPDTKRYWFQVRPLFNAELSPYFGQTFSVSLCEGELKKLDPKFLPDGYPYEVEGSKGSVEHIPDEDNASKTELNGFPLFAVGDTVSVTVNGVKYSLVAFEDEGVPAVGDAFFDVYSGAGQYGWCVYCETDGKVYIYNNENCTVSWDFSKVVNMAEKFLPVSPQIINLYIGSRYEGSNVYASPEKRDNQEPMTRDEFLGLVPRNANGDEIPYIVVLTSYSDKYTVIECKDLGDKIRFYTMVASNGEYTEMHETFTEGGGVD